jgi:hypothetical protein
MPIGSWQFWIVTAIVLFALWIFIRPFFPRWKKTTCCSSASKPKKTTLTVGGKQKK